MQGHTHAHEKAPTIAKEHNVRLEDAAAGGAWRHPEAAPAISHLHVAVWPPHSWLGVAIRALHKGRTAVSAAASAAASCAAAAAATRLLQQAGRQAVTSTAIH
jgi:hypothetical protein